MATIALPLSPATGNTILTPITVLQEQVPLVGTTMQPAGLAAGTTTSAFAVVVRSQGPWLDLATFIAPPPSMVEPPIKVGSLSPLTLAQCWSNLSHSLDCLHARRMLSRTPPMKS
ncbi:unnamed protein product [Prunus armeniaca]